jgi:hypothetical protein
MKNLIPLLVLVVLIYSCKKADTPITHQYGIFDTP